MEPPAPGLSWRSRRLREPAAKASTSGCRGAIDAKPFVKRVYEAFGADRMIWGELGANMAEFDNPVQLFDSMFEFAPEPQRAKIRGLTSQKLFGFA
jgi:predicted TIM-barrel fold metal-dependent hydrolase